MSSSSAQQRMDFGATGCGSDRRCHRTWRA